MKATERTRPSEAFLTTQDAAAVIGGVTPAQVSRWCVAGLISGAVRFPGRVGWRIPKAAWDKFLSSRSK